MRSLGQTIKDIRNEGGLTLAELERETKIKKSFLSAIEEGQWQDLPEYPVVQGFVRSVAHVLDIDENLLLALLRRDYPKKDLRITPKPDVRNRFIWSPKWTLLVSVSVVIIAIIGYLGVQYKHFVSPPELIIMRPLEGATITNSPYHVEGKTTPDASVTVNNQPTLVSDNGDFSTDIEVAKETSEITVKATSRSGKETEVKKKVKVEFPE